MKKKLYGTLLGVTLTAAAWTPFTAWADDDYKKITLIHIGDIHGHTTPRPNLRSDGDGRMEGGLARMATKINQIRRSTENTLLINTGDTTQGSGEALYSRGQALVDVVDMLGVDAFAPGNWEFVYGPDRFKEFFGNGTGRWYTGNRWGALASNLYNTANKNADGKILNADGTVATSPAFPAGIPATLPRVHTKAQNDDWHTWYLNNGSRILPPYAIKKVDDVKVGIVGCTTRRGPQVVGKWVVAGIEFTDCAKEVPKYVQEVRAKGVDLVVVISEIEIGANIQLLKSLGAGQHVDVILNSDMHEETVKPIEVTDAAGLKSLIIEEGQDGTQMGELKLKISRGKVASWDFTSHRIHDGISEDYYVAKKVREVRAPYTTKFAEYAANPTLREKFHKNPFGNTYLNGSLDEVVGYSLKDLHRNGFTDEAVVNPGNADAMPAAIEGTSHDWIADAIRWWAKSDVATVRGFRYGTHIRANGPITRNDLYHYVPIGARVGKAGKIHANQLRNQVDNSSLSVFSTDPSDTNVYDSPYNNEGWAGGWMFAYSGPTLEFDPYWVRRGPTPGVYPGDSRSRGISMTLTCDRLPAAEKDPNQVCEKVDGKWSYSKTTMINDNRTSEAAVAAGKRPGDWTAAWNAAISAETNASFQDLVINDSYGTAGYGTWSSKKAPTNHNKQNHMPVIEVAGYYFANAPYTLNNCPNCNPRGYSAIVPGENLAADAAYLLPVNMDPVTGRAMLDDNGRPVLKTENGITKWVNGQPVVDGDEIDLTMILEKYLQRPGQEGSEYAAYDLERGRGDANPASHRVKLQKALPGREYFGGTAMMQPLCGVVTSFYSKADPNLSQAEREAIAVAAWGAPTADRIMPSPNDPLKPFPGCP